MSNSNSNIYLNAVSELKSTILESRFLAANLVNKELLKLYFYIGKYVSFHTRNKNWGAGAIESISNLLQQELPGLRGFSATNIKNMRIFFEEWCFLEHIILLDSSSNMIDYSDLSIRQMPSAESLLAINNFNKKQDKIRQMPSAELEMELKLHFMNIGFSHHRQILNDCKIMEERIFYIKYCANENWSFEKLKYKIKSKLYENKGEYSNNFKSTLQENTFQNKVLNTFKDEMLLDFINIDDYDEEPDERVLEKEIILNIKKFIMALGSDFSFIGNQYRIKIENEEFFIDLLFFNRKLQSLVAIELKKGKFKAEYVGKMNLYLSALDEFVKEPFENPSIGIILCKEKNNTIVEFAFRDTSKPIGVITYKTANELPIKYKNILPDAEKLKQLL